LAERNFVEMPLMVQVSCNLQANAIAGYPVLGRRCHDAAIALEESHDLTACLSQSKRLKKIAITSRVASCGSADAQPHPHPCNFELYFHRTDRLQALEMSNGRQ
jgi:hypothetical protein